MEDLSDLVPGAIGSRDGGKILINSDRLTIKNGAEVSASTFGQGQGGNIQINATDVEISNSFINASANRNKNTFSTGDGGNIEINAQSLRLTEGGLIVASTASEGRGGILQLMPLK